MYCYKRHSVNVNNRVSVNVINRVSVNVNNRVSVNVINRVTAIGHQFWQHTWPRITDNLGREVEQAKSASY